MKELQISTEPIELCKLLKFGNLVSSGGEAKTCIQEGLVSVNGTVETRKRKKILAGESIEFRNEKYLVKLGR